MQLADQIVEPDKSAEVAPNRQNGFATQRTEFAGKCFGIGAGQGEVRLVGDQSNPADSPLFGEEDRVIPSAFSRDWGEAKEVIVKAGEIVRHGGW